jgi:hypothetical protein
MAGNLVVSTINGVAIGVINAIINGNFGINQRGVSGTVTLAAGAYGHDRWKAGASGCTYTFATVDNVTTLTISAGSLIQVIEGLNLQSGTYTLSWTGTAQGKIGAGSYAASGVQGTAVGGTNLNIEYGTGTVSLVQFEKGSVATPFEFRSIGQELALCQRYYFKIVSESANQNNLGVGYIEATTQAQISNTFPVTMRTRPTALEQSGTAADYVVRSSAGTTACSTVPAFGTSSTNLGQVIFNVASGLTAGGGCLGRNASTNAFLAWSAEL